ncbi:hypothetical protein OIE68_00435 [Nocardia vinacea]|uniref:hypothetical protein n=1 Tax=Nocardia vinacea TaxID=96468 RepID=UPI002E14B6D2|nr:hypothetical protein OIE68_00435 [Nocardia vinacea]
MDFLDFTQQVAASLGPMWRAERGYMIRRHLVLKGPADQSRTITHGDDSSRRCDHGRLHIEATYGRFGRYHYSTEPRHSDLITIAAHRAPADIATAIARRLLPGYQRTLAVCRTRAREDAAVLSARNALLDQLAAILAPVQRDREDRISFGGTATAVSGSIRIRYSGESEVELRVAGDRVLDRARTLPAHATAGMS